jgi:hypothetical protein
LGVHIPRNVGEKNEGVHHVRMEILLMPESLCCSL